MTRPPSQAPSALATLSEAWFIAAPSVCASPETSISRSWRLTTSTEPIAVTRKITGSSHQPYGATRPDQQHHQRRSRRRARSACGRPTSRPAGRPARCRPPCRGRRRAVNDRDRRLGQAADVGDGRGDVGVDREQAAEADRTGEQGQHRLRRCGRTAARGGRSPPGRPGRTARTPGPARRSAARARRRRGTPSASRAAGRARSRRARRPRWRPRGRASRSRPRGPRRSGAAMLAATSEATPK